MQKAKYSSAKEPISIQYANKRATRMLGTDSLEQVEDTRTNHRQAPQRWAAAGDGSATP
jgi:hypothetical protein